MACLGKSDVLVAQMMPTRLGGHDVVSSTPQDELTDVMASAMEGADQTQGGPRKPGRNPADPGGLLGGRKGQLGDLIPSKEVRPAHLHFIHAREQGIAGGSGQVSSVNGVDAVLALTDQPDPAASRHLEEILHVAEETGGSDDRGWHGAGLQLFDEALSGIHDGQPPEGLGCRHGDHPKALDSGSLGLLEEVEIGPILDVLVAHLVGLPGDSQGGKDGRRSFANPFQGACVRDLGFVMRRGQRDSLARSHDGDDFVPSPRQFGDQVTPQVSSGSGHHDTRGRGVSGAGGGGFLDCHLC